MLHLGLIGDNIAASSAPKLHRLAGRQNRIEVRYDRLVPRDEGLDFDALLAACPARGYRGLNITYPYKERAIARVSVPDALVQAMGAINTILFDPDGARGFNTDYTGFVATYHAARGARDPGTVCLVGTGGVGRAIAFALVALGAGEIRLVDQAPERAAALAGDLAPVAGRTRLLCVDRVEQGAAGATGVINATPLGMVGLGGTAVPETALTGVEWTFDAVYTPVETEFLDAAARQGATTISGYELFFFQGVHAWAHFSGLPLDEAALRAALAAAE